MADQRTPNPDADDDEQTARDVLDAFNAEDVIDRPGPPVDEPSSPASDADAPAPPG